MRGSSPLPPPVFHAARRTDHTKFVANDALLSKIYSKFDSTRERSSAAVRVNASGESKASGSSSKTTSSRAGSAGSLGGHVDMWIIPFEDLCLFQQIGEGSYGRVRLGFGGIPRLCRGPWLWRWAGCCAGGPLLPCCSPRACSRCWRCWQGLVACPVPAICFAPSAQAPCTGSADTF